MTAVSTATRRAERFFAEVAEEFGTRSGEIVTIPMRQCELARRKAIAASTVAAHVRAMGERVLQRRPTIVITDDRGPDRATAQNPSRERQADLVNALNDVVQAQQRLIDVLMNSAKTLSRNVAENRGTVADLGIHDALKAKESKEEACLLPADELIREDRRGTFADSTAIDGAQAGWSMEDLDRVLAPLHDIVRERRLKPMNNRASLARSLADLDLTEIDAAVQRLISMTANEPVTSPFGLLVSWARRSEGQMFSRSPGPPSRTRVHAASLVVNDDPDPIDADAARIITTWEAAPDVYAEQLASIDQQIVTDNGAIPLIDVVGPLRHAFRVEALSLRLRERAVVDPASDDSASANAYVNVSAGTLPT